MTRPSFIPAHLQPELFGHRPQPTLRCATISRSSEDRSVRVDARAGRNPAKPESLVPGQWTMLAVTGLHEPVVGFAGFTGL